jgi:carbon monoxide dehydrogenase subunit G
MDLSHRFVVPASVETTWAAFNDLERIAPCFPGATITSVEGDDFSGSVKVKLGPIAMLYNGSGTFVERDESQHRAVIKATGKDKRGNGTAGVTVVAHMLPEGEGTTVELTSDLSITGKPAQFGRGVMQDVSDKLLGQFVDCIAGRLGEEEAPAPLPVEPAAASPSSSEEVGTAPEPAPAATSPPTQQPQAAELNLMSAVLPVMLRRYGLPVAGLVVIAVIIWFVAR